MDSNNVMPNVTHATIRDADDELHIECRFVDGQKFAAITIDKAISYHNEIANNVCGFINVMAKQQGLTPPKS